MFVALLSLFKYYHFLSIFKYYYFVFDKLYVLISILRVRSSTTMGRFMLQPTKAGSRGTAPSKHFLNDISRVAIDKTSANRR